MIAEVARYDDEVRAFRVERYKQYHEQVADSIGQMQRHGVARYR